MKYAELPLYPGALDMYRKGETTDSNGGNRLMVRGNMEIQASLTGFEEELLFDPQTSGGLLLSVPGPQAEELVAALSGAEVQAAVRVAEIIEGPPEILVV